MSEAIPQEMQANPPSPVENGASEIRKRALEEGASFPALKKPKPEITEDVFDFLPDNRPTEPSPRHRAVADIEDALKPITRQFWKAGDIEGQAIDQTAGVGIDHVRVHPKFLHSNATSHKWALGAFAELLDNAIDEAQNGATFVNVDVIANPRDKSPMLLVEDNGGGMTMDRMRQCMSFGYSEKSKSANTIGQYGNGFKTSTMRLGADVVVFSKSPGKGGSRPTRSIGLLSYTFLRRTRQQDIVVPMIDYELHEEEGMLKPVFRGTEEDWKKNMQTIVDWGPYGTADMLRNQLTKIKKQGTRIIIYTLWDNDQGELELDFETDAQDIHVRGVRDERNIKQANTYRSARPYLLYQHSLRVYASLLYLRLPDNFTIKLRKQDVEHHNIVSDLMHVTEKTYTPKADKDSGAAANMTAVVTLGFVKDAKEHIDVQGFCVYHKNRLIKPFWRIWNPAGSQGRGVVGVLEANFVEPAHDKQGFERTSVLQRLEQKLQVMQKNYWVNNCHLIGYGGKKKNDLEEDETSWLPGSARKQKEKAAKSAKKHKEIFPSSSSEEEDYGELEGERPPKKTSRKSTRGNNKEANIWSLKQLGQTNRCTLKQLCQQEDNARDQQLTKRTAKEAIGSLQHKSLSTQVKNPLHMRKEANSELQVKLKALAEASSRTNATPLASPLPRNIVTRATPMAVNNEILSVADDDIFDEADPNDVKDAIDQLKELTNSNNALSSRLDKLEKGENAKLEVAQARNRELEEQIARMESELQVVQEVLLKERDGYKEALEEEKRQREIDDKEIRRQLKEAHQKVRKLEAEKKSLEEENARLRAEQGQSLC